MGGKVQGVAVARLRRCSADDPACRGGRGIARRSGAQQQRERAALRRGEREPPHAPPHRCCRRASRRSPDGRGAAQRLLHRPEQVAPVRSDHQQPFGRDAEGIEPGAVRRAAFGERHVLGDPDQAKRGGSTLRHRQREAGRCGKMRLASCRDFVERAADEAAAEDVSRAGMPKGRVPGRSSIPGAFCKACRCWRSWSIIPKPLKTRIHSDQRAGPSGFIYVLGLF